MGNRVIQVEAGAILVRVEGTDSLRSLEACAGRLVNSVRDAHGRVPMGFQAGETLHTERSPEGPQ